MAFCSKCGTQVQDGVSFCPSCGGAVGAAPAGQPQQQTPVNDAEANKGMAVLAYILFFVPLLTGAHKTSPFVKYHTNQGTILFIFAVAFGVVEGILSAILRAIFYNPATWYSGSWGLWGLISTLLNILWLAPTILCVLGIINAVGGKTKELPVIGKFQIIK
jgi:uncharacterized membrane protein